MRSGSTPGASRRLLANRARGLEAFDPGRFVRITTRLKPEPIE